eukprot:SAG31_NODE_15784_length_739_cov_0.890625_1_plen_20_part_10
MEGLFRDFDGLPDSHIISLI